jgi:WD40 repeat protein
LYPYQTLPAHPIAVLASEPIQRSTGYIDHHHPHAINSLTIGELGSEEVLVSAHDDGDVCVWYTSNLQRMALQLSVEQSAWGVALHKERRLLAVSANSHLITVFDLAVRGEHAKSGEGHEQSGRAGEETQGGLAFESVRPRREPWSGEKTDALWGPDGDKKRSKREATIKDKTVKTLKGHGNNIPNIAFLDDSSGRWLVGTAIDGMVILWDVHTEKMVEKCKLGYLQYVTRN